MTLLPLLLAIGPLFFENRTPTATSDVRLVMLSAAAAQLCLVSQMPAEEQTPATVRFLQQLNSDFPGHYKWLKSERTFEGAVELSFLLDDSCQKLKVPKLKFRRTALPYLR